MALKPLKRKYSFSDATLGEKGDSICAFSERDLTEMTGYGYNQAAIDLIKVKIDDFKDFPADEFFSSEMMGATSVKNKAIKDMSELAESIVHRAVLKWEEGSWQVKGFGFTGYATKNDAEKTAVCRLVFQKGTQFLTELAGQGLVQTMLDDLKTITKDADEAITAKALAVSKRDEAVNIRITLGNDLYAVLVKLANTGKHIWEDKDESKYNDYIIYESHPGTQLVTGSVAPASVHSPSVALDSSGDEIEITVTAGSLIAYCSDDPTDEPAVGQVTITIDAANPWSGLASALAWSSINFRLLLKNASATDAADFSVRVS